MIDSTEFEDILDRVKNGQGANDRELAAVRKALDSPIPEDPYTLLHILGKVGDLRCVPSVERFLIFGIDNPLDDGMVRRLATEILGQWWTVADEFEPISRSAFEDPSPLVRAAAASAIGDLGRAHARLAAKAARTILRGLDLYGSEQHDVWGAFYEAALTIAGVNIRDRPLRPARLTPAELDEDVLAKVRALASTEPD